MKLANKRYTTIKNDYCLTLGDYADVVELKEADYTISGKGYNFTDLSKLDSLE